MDMVMPTSTATEPAMASVTSHDHNANTGMSMNMPMGMATTFSTSTEVTLLFSGWTTDTPAKYFGTLIFVFVITILNRFLGAWRSQLSRKWADQAAVARVEQMHRRRAKQLEREARGTQRSHRKSASLAQTLSDKEEWQPLSPAIPDGDCHGGRSSEDEEEEAMEKKLVDATLAPKWTKVFGNRWRATHPWRFGIDIPRALLEGLRAFVGYVL